MKRVVIRKGRQKKGKASKCNENDNEEEMKQAEGLLTFMLGANFEKSMGLRATTDQYTAVCCPEECLNTGLLALTAGAVAALAALPGVLDCPVSLLYTVFATQRT
jgi:hypothetical protein